MFDFSDQIMNMNLFNKIYVNTILITYQYYEQKKIYLSTLEANWKT